jgi:hypothetical protein
MAALTAFVAIVIVVLVTIIINAAFIVRIACATSIPGIVVIVANIMATPVMALFATVAAFTVTVAAIFTNFGSMDGFGILFAAVVTLSIIFVIIFSFIVRFWGSLVNLNNAGCYRPSSIDCPHLMNITS